jgi:Tol biopolymer transport system component
VIRDCVPVGEADENAYEQLRLAQVGSANTEIADSQLQVCGGLGAFGLAGLFWSPNSRYFYYTSAREDAPDGCGGFWEPPILRFDVTTLKSENLGGGTPSPDGTKLVTWLEKDLLVWDVNAGEIARIPAFASGVGTGPLIWSPDSQSLVYVQVDSYCPLSGTSYVIRIDLPESKQTLLLESETPSFGSATWENQNELCLQDENGDEWVYDFTSEELRAE